VIASLEGRVESFGDDWIIINVGGVGFQVYTPASSIGSVRARGEEVKLYTHLVLREDYAVLYGFASTEELALFQTLLGVSGLGPRLGLAMLSAMEAEQLATAIAAGNAALLTTIPGIGKRVAERIILELKEKVGAGLAVAPLAQVSGENTEVLAALTALGYSAAEAARAVAALPATPGLALEEKVKLALQHFGSR
jgi:Holliday junction DNA helicase RuvA